MDYLAKVNDLPGREWWKNTKRLTEIKVLTKDFA